MLSPAHRFIALLLLTTLAGMSSADAACAAEEDDRHPRAGNHRDPACFVVDRSFADEVWAKVGEQTCLKCHNTKGDAAESNFLLQEPAFDQDGQDLSLRENLAAFKRMAELRQSDESRLLVKVAGGLEHGGGEVVKPGSTGYRLLEQFVRGVKGSPLTGSSVEIDEPRPFFAGVEMMSPRRLLRRVTLSLAGRLPSAKEQSAVDSGAMQALDPILDDIMQEDAYYERLQEAFNDILLTRGLDDVAETVFSYDHFEKTRNWPQRHDFGDLPEKDRLNASYALYRVYRETILREPLELIKYIVRNDRPFTELVTADYIMVSPYTARGYGIFEDLKEQFADAEDPFEYIPTRLPALTSRNGKMQESATGFYPHAGLLSTFHYVRRYPTTDTNRNRLRARMYYQHFLGIDIMQLAPRVTDAAAVDAKYEIPTMQAADCVVCHKTIDPLAGLFQDYDKDGYVARRREGWYEDMFGPGLDAESLPDAERWRALQWLGERTAKDPRFAVAMVEHVYYVLMGRNVLRVPQDIDDPMFASKRRAYLAQRQMISAVADEFVQSGFNLKVAFKSMIATEIYRADGVATAALQPERRAELDDIGVVRMLTPEQLERKVKAIFGKQWGRLESSDSKLDILYGGIDSKEVTERIVDPSGAMGAIQRILANDMACKHVAVEFTTERENRRLFPNIELDILPGVDPESDLAIRQAIVYLHEYILGRFDAVDSAEVDRTYELFAGIIQDAQEQQGLGTQESYFCRAREDQRLDDPNYTLRSWRAVVTYLLRQHEFLYE